MVLPLRVSSVAGTTTRRSRPARSRYRTRPGQARRRSGRPCRRPPSVHRRTPAHRRPAERYVSPGCRTSSAPRRAVPGARLGGRAGGVTVGRPHAIRLEPMRDLEDVPERIADHGPQIMFACVDVEMIHPEPCHLFLQLIR